MNVLHALQRLRLAAPCALVMLLAGCSNQELYSQLSERQANEMVALLRQAGLKADKQSQEGRFSVLTSRSDFSLAVRTLSAQGYPREQFDTMGKIFKREGFVSSPLEERARLVHALSQEISNTVANIDGVVTARVHLVVPERNPLADKPRPAAAAVFIKHRPDKDLAAQTAQIKALVVNSIEGLPYDNVTVALFPAESWAQEAPKAAPTPAQRRASLDMPLLAGTAAGGLALCGGGMLWWRRRGTPRAAAAPSSRAVTGHTSDALRGGPSAAHLPDELQAALRRAANPAMNAPLPASGTEGADRAAATARAARARRGRRAAIAQRLLAKAPDATASLDWDTLDGAPVWLALPDRALDAFERQVGALLCAPALRLWIDGTRIAAARAALGDAFMQALLAQPDLPAIEPGVPACPRLDSAEQVGVLLQAAGAAVLLASLPAGALRRAAATVLAPAVPLVMAPALAQALVARAQAMAVRCSEKSA